MGGEKNNRYEQALTPAMFQILLALAEGRLHGYAIIRRAREEGDFRLGPATLYRTLNRLREMDLITESEERPPGDLDDERRFYYEITKEGLGVLAERVVRMEADIRRARALRILPEAPGQ